MKFPRRPRAGPHKGELLWGELTRSRALQVLHNPRYAGAFVFGKTRIRKSLEGPAILNQAKRRVTSSMMYGQQPGVMLPLACVRISR